MQQIDFRGYFFLHHMIILAIIGQFKLIIIDFGKCLIISIYLLMSCGVCLSKFSATGADSRCYFGL